MNFELLTYPSAFESDTVITSTRRKSHGEAGASLIRLGAGRAWATPSRARITHSPAADHAVLLGYFRGSVIVSPPVKCLPDRLPAGRSQDSNVHRHSDPDREHPDQHDVAGHALAESVGRT